MPRLLPRALALRAVLSFSAALLTGCSSTPPPQPPKDDLSTLARVNAVDIKLDEQEKARAALAARVTALEASLGTRPKPDADLAARLAALETKLSSLEDKVAFLEMARAVDQDREQKAPKILDRKRPPEPAPAAPEPNEVVKPLAALTGESFSFVRAGKVEFARLAGVEAPGREDEAAATRAKERLEELLMSGELRFDYPAPAPEGRLLVYARTKKSDGSELVVNEILLREGLVLAVGDHARKADFEKAQTEAKAARRGLFAR